MSDMVRVGDKVTYTTRFGNGFLDEAAIVGLEVTGPPNSKSGERVCEAPWALVRANKVVFTLDNGRWCYSHQINIPNKEVT